jgi:hypothetical protein
LCAETWLPAGEGLREEDMNVLLAGRKNLFTSVNELFALNLVSLHLKNWPMQMLSDQLDLTAAGIMGTIQLS